VTSRAPAYLSAVAAVAAATALTSLIRAWIMPSVSLLFFPAIVLPSMYGGYGPGLLATILSAVSMAYFFVPPLHTFDIGVDDGIRLLVFAVVALPTSWLSSQRRHAERAQSKSLDDLRGAMATLRKVSGWPVVAGADAAAASARMLSHAANVVGASAVVARWEAEDEPWVYLATQTQPIERHPPDAFAGEPGAPHPDILARLGPGEILSARFDTEHLIGRAYFAVVAADAQLEPMIDVVAREIGNSLDQLYLAARDRQLAVREDRLLLSRDLHDGVLQALTGIRLEIQTLAEASSESGNVHARLLAIERALAIEQRELRRFIDGLKPGAGNTDSGSLLEALTETSRRLTSEWRTAVTVRINPPDLTLPLDLERGVRLMIHEAVVNALRHAHPTRVTVGVDAVGGTLKITVADDGRGFAFTGTLDHEALASVGPASLRERVSALAGRMTISSGPVGSRIEVAVPLSPRLPAA
jgi:signal transduction histidine kinase